MKPALPLAVLLSLSVAEVRAAPGTESSGRPDAELATDWNQRVLPWPWPRIAC